MTTEHKTGSPGAVEEVPKDHFDTDGNPCTLDTLCRREPAWAANIIRTLRARVAWHPASNPPNLDSRVLVWQSEPGGYIRVTGYSTRDGFAVPNVTHWMPLPEVPK